MKRITKLRDYQREGLDKTKISLQAGINRQLGIAATGTGKTVTAGFMHGEIYPDEPTLFIVHRKELAKQTKDTFKAIYPEKSVGIEMGSRYAKQSRDEIVVLSIDTWGRAGNKRIERFDPDYFRKVIVDEAHTSPTPRYERVLSYFGVGPDNLKDDRLLFGMTATPNRPDGVKLSKIFDDITFNYDLIWGIANGWLTDLERIPIKTDIDLAGVKQKGREFDPDDLSIRVNVASRNEQIIKAYFEFSEGRRSVAFCASVDHAYELAETFKGYGIPAAAISARTSKSDRKDYIEAFHKGDILVLTNFGTLNEGFDETELDSILMARPIKSKLLYTQSIGRGSRPSKSAMVDLCATREQRLRAIENSRKPYCKVIDFVDNYDMSDIITLPQLFGLHDEIQTNDKRMFKDVYEPLKDIQEKYGIDISELTDLNDVELKIEQRQRLSIRSLEVPKDIKKMSKFAWVEIGNEKWELSLYNDNIALIVEVNTIDRYDLYEVDLETGERHKMNEHGFGSLQGAINVADQYAEGTYDTKWTKHNERWRKYGVTEKQFDQITRHFQDEIDRGLLEIDEVSEYRDTEMPFVYYNYNGEKQLLKRGTAKELLGNYYTNKKKQRAKARG